MARYHTVRGNIFLWVSLLMVSVLLAFSLVVYDYASSVARERFSEALTSLSRSVMANLDAQVAEVNRLSLTLIYSQVFRSLFSKHLTLPHAPTTVQQRIAKLENTEALIEIGDTVLGPNQSAPQVNIYDLKGEMIGAGYYSRLIERNAKAEPWFAQVMGKNGDRVILGPHRDPLQEETSVVVKGKVYLSLLRSFQDPLLSIQGIVEVKQYCDSLFAELDLLGGSTVTLFVLDGDGRLLYPYEGPSFPPGELALLPTLAQRGSIATGSLPGQGEPQIYATAVSRETGWTLILGEPSKGLSANLYQYALRIALLTLTAILCSLAASYFLARRVTVPLQALHAEIESLELHNLDDLAEGGRTGNDLTEIDALRMAFREMRVKLGESVLEAVSLRAHEREAELVALQSQLNPHFLHNMLQTIAIMADEGNLASIQGLITNLSKVVRYVGSNEGPATLGTEIECAECYLAAMRARFGDSLEYLVDFPASLAPVIVPRLIIQPFLENCFKYATSQRPPWRIELRGAVAEDRWTVEILDNGSGFTEESLRRLSQRIATERPPGEGLAPMSIAGLGLFNCSERLRLTFGDRAIFEVGNREGGGARVVLGAWTHG